MRRIVLGGKLGQGKFALVDDEDFDKVSQYRWHIHKDRYNHTSVVTTRNFIKANGKKTCETIRMHRMIMDFPLLGVDHINGDTLDNRKQNLRIVTQSQNMKNRKPSGKSPYLGVSKHGSKWIARVSFGDGRRSVGTFTQPEEAAQNYDYHAQQTYGEFARLNFPLFDYSTFRPKRKLV